MIVLPFICKQSKSLKKMADPAPVQLGIEMAKKAIEYDNGHMYVQALMCYDLAVDYFGKALHAEQNEQVKDTLAAKIKEYTERSTFLKVSLGMNNMNLGGTGGATQSPGLQPLNQPFAQPSPMMNPFSIPASTPPQVHQEKDREKGADPFTQPSAPVRPPAPTGYVPQQNYTNLPAGVFYTPPPQTGYLPQVSVPPQGYIPQQPMYYYTPQQQPPPLPPHNQPVQHSQPPPLPPHNHSREEKGKDKEKGEEADGEKEVEAAAAGAAAGGLLGLRTSKPVETLKAGTDKIKSSFTKVTATTTHFGFMQDNFGIAEDLFEKFSCSRKLLAGFMYITENYVCWNTIVKSMDRRVVIKITDITSLSKSKLGGINIETADKQEFTFSNFALNSRKSAYELILRQAKKLNALCWQHMNFKLNKKLDSVEKKEDKRKAKTEKKELKEIQKAWKKGELSTEEYLKHRHEAGEQPIVFTKHKCSYQTTLSSTKGEVYADDLGIHFDGQGKQFVVPYDEITGIKKSRQVLKGDVLLIMTLANEHVFNNFFDRDEAVKQFKFAWRSNRHGH